MRLRRPARTVRPVIRVTHRSHAGAVDCPVPTGPKKKHTAAAKNCSIYRMVLDCAIYGEGPTVVLVHGTGGERQLTWSDQLPLSKEYRLTVPDRRGYGASPPATRVDFDVDARDIADILGTGAHLVGFSYGAIGSLLAAAMRPDAVYSLAVIEPPAFAVARGEPNVESLISRLEPVYARAGDMTPHEYDRAFDNALGFDHVERTQSSDQLARLDAARNERRPWEARIPLGLLRRQTFPKVMFRGDWNPAFSHVAGVIAESIGAELVTIPGGHGVQHSPGFNERILELWVAGRTT
jgi:pimeloyl-ACP methyl ester carboxylesterase